jgi:hypothetical protein
MKMKKIFAILAALVSGAIGIGLAAHAVEAGIMMN